MSEYDALLREAEELQEGWRTVDDGTAEARLVRCIADLAAALRASEARADRFEMIALASNPWVGFTEGGERDGG